ncbi:hypothetical protein [Streptomyces sp. NBC_01618]|uniref:hypothetical protein n=1 Tax=Streptomyces sp. NBC_01618 TaxID=2975900 RepID=UPI00386571FB|nr:hypothetical protein OH735_05625 [Streptomyces sp. NBC_01618]
MDRAEGALRAEPGQVALGLLQDAGHGVHGDAEDVRGATAEEAWTGRCQQHDRAGQVSGLRPRHVVVLRRFLHRAQLPGVFRFVVRVLGLAQDPAQRRARPFGERCLFEYGKAGY